MKEKKIRNKKRKKERGLDTCNEGILPPWKANGKQIQYLLGFRTVVPRVFGMRSFV
jgi:hypothetical protein